MAEDTAVLDMPDTGTAGDETPELDAPETDALLDSPETEQASEDGSETEPETLTREEAERLATEKVAAREKELADAAAQSNAEALDAWQKQQYEQSKTQAVQTRQNLATGELKDFAMWVYKQGEDGKNFDPSQINPKVIGRIAYQLEGMVFQAEYEALDAITADRIQKDHPDFRATPELTRQLERAIHTRDPKQMVEAKLDLMRAAMKETLLAEARAEVAAESEDTKKTDAMKAAEAKRTAQGRPTSTNGGAVPGRATLETMDPKSEAYAKAYERKYGFRP